MLIGDTNVTPMPLNPSHFATIKSWAAESLPSRTTLVVRHLPHDQLYHRHNGQHGSCWCWSRSSTLPLRVLNRDLVIECSRSSSIRNSTRISARYFALWPPFPNQIKWWMVSSRNSGWQYAAFSGAAAWVETTTAACQFHMTSFQFMRI